MGSTTYENPNNMRAVKIPGTPTTEALLMMPRCFVAHEVLQGGGMLVRKSTGYWSLFGWVSVQFRTPKLITFCFCARMHDSCLCVLRAISTCCFGIRVHVYECVRKCTCVQQLTELMYANMDMCAVTYCGVELEFGFLWACRVNVFRSRLFYYPYVLWVFQIHDCSFHVRP